MPADLTLRILVINPPPGVAWAVQSGRTELIKALEQSAGQIVFEVRVRLGATRSDGKPALLGPVTKGTPASRFLYANSGTGAGQADSCWDRRAKVPLTGITRQLIERVQRSPGVRLEARFMGTGRDGGPACATVALLGGGWRVIEPAG